MKKGYKSISILTVLFIFLCMTASSVLAEGGDSSPTKVAKEFAYAYFMLEDSLGDYLSEDAKMNEDEEDLVEKFFDKREAEAHDRGYSICYLKMLPANMKAKVIDQDESSAKIHFTATTIRSINPLFRAVGYIFGLIEENDVEATFTVVKEEDGWKVGPGAFDMPI